MTTGAVEGNWTAAPVGPTQDTPTAVPAPTAPAGQVSVASVTADPTASQGALTTDTVEPAGSTPPGTVAVTWTDPRSPTAFGAIRLWWPRPASTSPWPRGRGRGPAGPA